jgi:hypothetical protein
VLKVCSLLRSLGLPPVPLDGSTESAILLAAERLRIPGWMSSAVRKAEIGEMEQSIRRSLAIL